MNRKEMIHNTGVSNRVIRRVVIENNIISKSSKIYNVNENYFENIDTEEKSYWLGFLYADGYVRMKNDRSGELKLKLKRSDKNHIELFKKCLGSTHKITDGISNVTVSGRTYTSLYSVISIYNKKIVQDLMNIGCTNNKTFNINMPLLKNDFIRHFIRGYFDGDGTICKYKKKSIFSFTSGSLIFLEQIQNIMCENITLNKLKISNYKSYHRFGWTMKNDINNIYSYLYDNTNIYLNRKKIIFEKIINTNE
ncbi:hypothetical protein M0Q50_01945 [bacterium]|jgi:hypothetical protein|nr:hypothetical protein [bacterium]